MRLSGFWYLPLRRLRQIAEASVSEKCMPEDWELVKKRGTYLNILNFCISVFFGCTDAIMFFAGQVLNKFALRQVCW